MSWRDDYKSPHRETLPPGAMSVAAFARSNGLSITQVRDLCKKGRIFGAHRHSTTNQWWIYPPAKVLRP